MSKKTLIQFLNQKRILTKFKKNLKRKVYPDLVFSYVGSQMPPLHKITYKDLEKIPTIVREIHDDHYIKISDSIRWAFRWNHTPEGHTYWEDINEEFQHWLNK